METTVVSLRDPRGRTAAIARAAARIRAGGLVAFPTETVYGLGADARSGVAVGRIYEAKRRDPRDPCIVHIAARDDLWRVAHISEDAESLREWVNRLADAFWPGPLSLILPRGPEIPPIVTAQRPSVAVRMPRHPTALALIRAAGTPIAAPSANTFMHTSPTSAAHVLADLDGRIELILDDGPTDVGVESTVLDLTQTIPTLLRPGSVSARSLATVLGVHIAQPERTAAGTGDAGLAAPGTLPLHYAPDAQVLLLDGREETVRREILRRARALQADGARVGALLTDEDAQACAIETLPNVVLARLGPASDSDTIARRLYAGMRELEAAGVTAILVRLIDGEGVAQAIGDRLRRAAGGRIERLP